MTMVRYVGMVCIRIGDGYSEREDNNIYTLDILYIIL